MGTKRVTKKRLKSRTKNLDLAIVTIPSSLLRKKKKKNLHTLLLVPSIMFVIGVSFYFFGPDTLCFYGRQLVSVFVMLFITWTYGTSEVLRTLLRNLIFLITESNHDII